MKYFKKYFLNITEQIDVEYYSTMAERRRVALAEALEENEQLHQEIDVLKNEIVALKNENSVLKPMAEEAEYLASVLKVKQLFLMYQTNLYKVD